MTTTLNKLTNTTAEEAIIASILVDGNNFPQASALLHPGDFFSDQHQRIYAAMGKLNPGGIDEITVAQKMQDLGTLKAGDCAYFAGIISRVPTSCHCKYYAQIVKDYSNRRRGITQAQKLAKDAYEGKVTQKRGIKL